MMHRIFYRYFSGSFSCTAVVKVVIGITLGMCLGTILFYTMPQQGLSDLAEGLISAEPGIGHGLLGAVLPLAISAGFLFFGLQSLALLAVPALSGLLLTFSAFVLGADCPALAVCLLLLGRCLSLVVLFWYLLCADRRDGRVLAVETFLCAALTVLIMLLSNWLTIPGIRVFAHY